MRKTRSWNQYLNVPTIICISLRFPEVIPLRNSKVKVIVTAFTRFFHSVEVFKVIYSDKDSNFISGMSQQVIHVHDVYGGQYNSTPCHPESQGAFDRFHQTLQTTMKTYSYQYDKSEMTGFILFYFLHWHPLGSVFDSASLN